MRAAAHIAPMARKPPVVTILTAPRKHGRRVKVHIGAGPLPAHMSFDAVANPAQVTLGPGSAKWVDARLREMCDVSRRIQVRGAWPAQIRTCWPDAPDEWTGYGYTDTRTPVIPPSPDAIDRHDEAQAWLAWLPLRQRRVAVAVASGLSLRAVARFDGRSYERIRQVYWHACRVIAACLRSYGC